MVPNNIKKEHLLKAIQEIDEKGVRKGRQSSTYDVNYNGKLYPPKLIISIANKFANGQELDSSTFYGGKGTDAFKLLKKEGFIIVEKVNPSEYDVLIEYVDKIKSGEVDSANSIKLLVDRFNFTTSLKTLDSFFFDENLKDINPLNYLDVISHLNDVMKIRQGNYNDFNVWSASKSQWNKVDSTLIERHDELNNKVGFPDNGNGLYKSFFGRKNLMLYLKNKFETDRERIYASIRIKMERAGFKFESKDIPHMQNRKEFEYKFVHPGLEKKFEEDGHRYRAKKFYLKPLSSDSNCEIGLVTGVSSPLLNFDFFAKPNTIDTHDNKRAWTNKEGIFALDELIDSVNQYLNNSQMDFVSEESEDYDTGNMNKIMQLNTILYGPPGTGKTYKLKNEYFERFTDRYATQTREEYLIELIDGLSWWEAIGVAMLELKSAKVNEIISHPIVQAKVSSSNSKSVRATIWGQMQTHTIEECKNVNVKDRRAPYIFNKNENSVWEVVRENVENDVPELIGLLEKYRNYQPVKAIKKRYVFTTFHQSISYEDFIEGIKPVTYEDEQNPEKGKQIAYEVQAGIFKQIAIRAKNDIENDYAIFIDEINRGNIANIFGELITLIEEDKRIDTANYIPVKLPYSNEDFGVPPNLYIIGTMNTADRSVEALDTALRRRFSFVEMNPKPEKLSLDEFSCEGVNLELLLSAINSRIEKLLDKDYCIGHSYFMTIRNRQNPLEELKEIFRNKILPLLQEYFYGDWGKIMLVVGKEFINVKKEKVNFLGTESYDDYEEYEEKAIYQFIDASNWTLDSFSSIYE